MLAEIFMLRMEAIARAAKEAAGTRFVPIALRAPKASERAQYSQRAQRERSETAEPVILNSRRGSDACECSMSTSPDVPYT
jgi:hypothetical protein